MGSNKKPIILTACIADSKEAEIHVKRCLIHFGLLSKADRKERVTPLGSKEIDYTLLVTEDQDIKITEYLRSNTA